MDIPKWGPSIRFKHCNPDNSAFQHRFQGVSSPDGPFFCCPPLPGLFATFLREPGRSNSVSYQVTILLKELFCFWQKAIYTWFVSGIYCQLGDYILPQENHQPPTAMNKASAACDSWAHQLGRLSCSSCSLYLLMEWAAGFREKSILSIHPAKHKESVNLFVWKTTVFLKTQNTLPQFVSSLESFLKAGPLAGSPSTGVTENSGMTRREVAGTRIRSKGASARNKPSGDRLRVVIDV